jgi:hypothetical protein
MDEGVSTGVFIKENSMADECGTSFFFKYRNVKKKMFECENCQKLLFSKEKASKR